MKLITESSRKTDRRDAEFLARLGRSDLGLLSPVHVRSERAQQVRGILRLRDALVRSRSTLINALRGVSKNDGRALPSCDAESFARKAWEALPTAARGASKPLLAAVLRLTREIRRYDRELERIARQEYGEATARLEQVSGVGVLTALAFATAVEDPWRFRNGRQMAAYLGLVPRLAQSGQADPQLGISKEGDRYTRRLLVGAAHYVLERGPDTDVKRWGLGLETRWGPKTRKRAAVAVARKLVGLLRRLWISGVAYRPLRDAAPAAWDKTKDGWKGAETSPIDPPVPGERVPRTRRMTTTVPGRAARAATTPRRWWHPRVDTNMQPSATTDTADGSLCRGRARPGIGRGRKRGPPRRPA